MEEFLLVINEKTSVKNISDHVKKYILKFKDNPALKCRIDRDVRNKFIITYTNSILSKDTEFLSLKIIPIKNTDDSTIYLISIFNKNIDTIYKKCFTTDEVINFINTQIILGRISI